MFKKILLPTDGSRHSAEAARFAGQLAKCHGGAVHPLVAVEYQYVTDDDVPPEVASTIRERIRRRAQAALDHASRVVEEEDGRSDGGRIVEGTPPEAILREAEEGEYDLIVMGSAGVSQDDGRRRLIGSVAERVLHDTPCPVLVIRAEPKP